MSSTPSLNFDVARSQMLAQQLRTCEVTDQRVLDVLATTPRESFVPQGFAELAFADTSIPIGHDQHMLTPQLEGQILQTLQIRSIDEILEIGTGTGYLTACLARLGAQVKSVDIFPEFVSAAERRFSEQRLTGITLESADATTHEWENAFDVVIISAALPQLTSRYTDLLKPGGRMFVFIGVDPVIKACLVTRSTDDSLETETLFETSVAPMINARSDAAFEL
jgi:protein-L-isoaspartate(D-aspartate) O-methyltransferase